MEQHAYANTIDSIPISPYAVPGMRVRPQLTSVKRTDEERILDAIAQEFCVSTPTIIDRINQRNPDTGKSDRHDESRVPRQIAHTLIKRATYNSLKEIGLRYGRVDHATVLHSMRTVSNYFQTDRQYRARIMRILESSGMQQLVPKLWNNPIETGLLPTKDPDHN